MFLWNRKFLKFLEGATRDQDNQNGHETKALEKFDFSYYQICSNSFEGHSTQDCGKDTVTNVELKLTDLQGFFVSMALIVTYWMTKYINSFLWNTSLLLMKFGLNQSMKLLKNNF